MPVQGSLRELSVVEALQLIGSQRKSVTLMVSSGEEELAIHCRAGLLIGIRTQAAPDGDLLIDALVARGHLSPSEGLRLAEQILDGGRDAWTLAGEISHLEKETLEESYRGVIEATLDRALLWDRGHFVMMPLAPITAVFNPGLDLEALLLDAMRRLDELSAWKQGPLPPASVPCLSAAADLGLSSDPLRRAVLRQMDGRRSISEMAEAARLGEYAIYETVSNGLDEGWIQILQIPDTAPPPASGPGGREIPRRTNILAILIMVLLLVATSSWVGRLLRTEDLAWQAEGRQWEQVDLERMIEAYRYRNGAYPKALADLGRTGFPVAEDAGQLWRYRIDREGYRLEPR